MKSEKFTAVADNHGDEIDPVCEDAFYRFIDKFKPDVRIHAGDLFNLAALRSKASEKDKTVPVGSDIEAGKRFFKRYFSAGSKKVFLRGNHDERLWDMLEEKDARLRELAERGTKEIEAMCTKYGVEMLPYDVDDGVWDYGHLRVIHGYAAGKNAGTRHAQAYGNCIYGHTHTQDVTPVEDHNGPSVALGIGCLLNIKQSYARANLGRLRHQNGWVYGLIFEDGTYQIFQTKRVGDKFYGAHEIKEI